MHEHPQLSAHPRRWLFEATRRMLSDQVHDVVRATRAAIQDAGVVDLEQVRQSAPLVRFSDDMHRHSSELKRFLFQHLYRHAQVMRMTDLARQVVSELFQAYKSDPNQMRAEFAQRTDTLRAISDYIAGMTDRFAQREHQRLTGAALW
jgi:dGTPase